jgi:hypothetical protein
MKRAIKAILKVLVERGDFDNQQEAWDCHKEDFKEIIELLNEGQGFEAEEQFTSVFGLEPDFFEPILFSM